MIDYLLIIGENNEQLAMNFTGIEKLSCRARNDIGETQENLYINIQCEFF